MIRHRMKAIMKRVVNIYIEPRSFIGPKLKIGVSVNSKKKECKAKRVLHGVRCPLY